MRSDRGQRARHERADAPRLGHLRMYGALLLHGIEVTKLGEQGAQRLAHIVSSGHAR